MVNIKPSGVTLKTWRALGEATQGQLQRMSPEERKEALEALERRGGRARVAGVKRTENNISPGRREGRRAREGGTENSSSPGTRKGRAREARGGVNTGKSAPEWRLKEQYETFIKKEPSDVWRAANQSQLVSFVRFTAKKKNITHEFASGSQVGPMRVWLRQHFQERFLGM